MIRVKDLICQKQQTGAYALRQCERCGVMFAIDNSSYNQSRRKFCDDCVRAAAAERDRQRRLDNLGLSPAAREAVSREEMMKRLARRDREYERLDVAVTTRTVDGVRVETRGRPCYGGLVAHDEFTPGYRFKV